MRASHHATGPSKGPSKGHPSRSANKRTTKRWRCRRTAVETCLPMDIHEGVQQTSDQSNPIKERNKTLHKMRKRKRVRGKWLGDWKSLHEVRCVLVAMQIATRPRFDVHRLWVGTQDFPACPPQHQCCRALRKAVHTCVGQVKFKTNQRTRKSADVLGSFARWQVVGATPFSNVAITGVQHFST